MLNEANLKMLAYIKKLSKIFNNNKIDFIQIGNAVDELMQYNEMNEYVYLNNLLYPEKYKNIAIPSSIPVPSCSFQLHNSISLTTNSSGNLGIFFSPYFLSSNSYNKSIIVETDEWYNEYTIDFFTTLFVNNDDSLDGTEKNINWKIKDIGQCIPPVYEKYRLVSASLVIRYIGSLDDISGVIGGAIVYEPSNEIGCHHYIKFYNKTTGREYGTLSRYTIPKYLAKYGNFDLAMDSYYHQENLILEGIRELYFPLDNSYMEYVNLMREEYVTVEQQDADNYHDIRGIYRVDQDYLKNGLNQMIYILGAPANQTCFKLDIYCNFECLPTSKFMNYLPINNSVCHCSLTNKLIREISEIVQKQSITKPIDENIIVPTIWDKLKNAIIK